MHWLNEDIDWVDDGVYLHSQWMRAKQQWRCIANGIVAAMSDDGDYKLNPFKATAVDLDSLSVHKLKHRQRESLNIHFVADKTLKMTSFRESEWERVCSLLFVVIMIDGDGKHSESVPDSFLCSESDSAWWKGIDSDSDDITKWVDDTKSMDNEWSIRSRMEWNGQCVDTESVDTKPVQSEPHSISFQKEIEWNS